jgi:hypothetical protein
MGLMAGDSTTAQNLKIYTMAIRVAYTSKDRELAGIKPGFAAVPSAAIPSEPSQNTNHEVLNCIGRESREVGIFQVVHAALGNPDHRSNKSSRDKKLADEDAAWLGLEIVAIGGRVGRRFAHSAYSAGSACSTSALLPLLHVLLACHG